MTSQVRRAVLPVPIASAVSLVVSAVAGGALLILPIPGWGWAALRAFLQF